MHNHGDCRFYNAAKEYSVADLAAFHGHLGPYLVVGYRIGKYAREHFCNDPFRLRAAVYCSGKPPESCIADGVQMGSGCTLGKRNIDVRVSPDLYCVFEENGKTLCIRPRPESVYSGVSSSGADTEQYAEAVAGWPDERIFEIGSL